MQRQMLNMWHQPGASTSVPQSRKVKRGGESLTSRTSDVLLVVETDAAQLLPKEVPRGFVLPSLLCSCVRRRNGERLAQPGTGATRVGCRIRDSGSQRSGGMTGIVREHALSCHGRHLASNCIRTRLAASPHRRPDLVRMLSATLVSAPFGPNSSAC